MIGPDDEVAASDASFVGPGGWVPWAERLVTEIREVRPKGLILVGGVDWAFDLRGIRWTLGYCVSGAHHSNRKRRTWGKALGGAGEVPVFVGEWGGTADDLEFGRQLLVRLRRLGLGWTAWSWADYPELVVTPRAPNFEPTELGRWCGMSCWTREGVAAVRSSNCGRGCGTGRLRRDVWRRRSGIDRGRRRCVRL